MQYFSTTHNFITVIAFIQQMYYIYSLFGNHRVIHFWSIYSSSYIIVWVWTNNNSLDNYVLLKCTLKEQIN